MNQIKLRDDVPRLAIVTSFSTLEMRGAPCIVVQQSRLGDRKQIFHFVSWMKQAAIEYTPNRGWRNEMMDVIRQGYYGVLTDESIWN